MKNFEDYVLYAVIAFLIVGVSYTYIISDDRINDDSKVNLDNDNTPNIYEKTDNSQGFSTISTGDTDSGNVQIELTPIIVGNQLIVDISANTHSVDLDQFDLLKITYLEYDNLKVNPVSAPKLSGHHASGEIVFDITKSINSFKIIINGIPKIQGRIFEW